MGVRDIFFIGVLMGGVATLSAGFPRSSQPHRTSNPTDPAARTLAEADAARDVVAIVAQVNERLRQRRDKQHATASGPASELAAMRRASLALAGSIPSLEQVREFEALPEGARVDRWIDALLADRRCADYLSERFARVYVGTEDGPFLVFRRRRFTTWLSDAILENRPYSLIVRDLIAADGLWMDHPSTNFVTVTHTEATGRPDPERLAARTSRAFLGIRLDCAQCHDHPFQNWKQADFRGLAAFYGGVHANLRGIHDGACDYQPVDRTTKQPTPVAPRVPFLSEILPAEGSPRARLAAWIVDPRNPHLARATVNRVWALLLGRPLVEPIDDIPAAGDPAGILAALADDFAAHDYNLHRLIRTIAAADAFRVDSASAAADGPSDDDVETWAAFPLTRLRPEQVAGSLFQAGSVATLGPRSPWLLRFMAYTGGNEFVKRFGDTGEDEFDARGGTIPQRLLLMNGDLVQSKTKEDLFNASARIAMQAPTDAQAVEVAYLAVLTRRPTAEEAAHFVKKLEGTRGDTRKRILADLFWTLVNTTEFSWNH